MPGFVSPYASAVTGNRLRPFPSAPLRTARESFDLKQLASGLCVERVPLRSFSMNRLVAPLTDDQGLAAAGRHDLDPGRLLPLSWSVQISQLADVVDLTASLGAAQFAFLSQKALQPSSATFADDSQDRFGVSHLAYLDVWVVRPPVSLRHVVGFPHPGLLQRLRDLGARAR